MRHRDPSEFEVEKLAQRTIGFSGAEIEQVVISGLYDAYDEKRELTSDDMINNIESSIPMSRTMSEKIQALRDWASQKARRASSTTAWDEEKALSEKKTTAKK